jgi:tetratricopeptide (TPR) repeat protein
VLRAASIFGRTAREAGVARVLGDEDALELVHVALRVLVQREVLEVAEGFLRFRHDLVRDAAYAMLTDADRQAGHAAAGAWLEASGEHDGAMLASHYDLAGDATAAAAWYVRAAEQALDGSDLKAALEHANRALDRGVTGELRGRALFSRALSYRWAGDLSAGLADARASIDGFHAGTAPWFSAVLQACVLGDAVGQREIVHELVALARSASPEDAQARGLRIRALGEGAAAHHHLGEHEQGDELARFIEREAEADLDDPSVALTVYRMRAVHAGYVEDHASELAQWVKIAECYERIGDRRMVAVAGVNVGYGWMMLGAFPEAEAALRHAAHAAGALGLTRAVAAAQHNLALVLACRGDFAGAVTVGAAAVATFVAAQDDRLSAVSRVYLAMIHEMAGDLERAEVVAREALADAEALPPMRPRARAVLARVLLRRGSVAEAEECSAAAMRALDAARVEGGDLYTRLVRVEALLAADRAADARAALEQAVQALSDAALRIGDASLRDKFLHCVPENARTLALAREHGVTARVG